MKNDIIHLVKQERKRLEYSKERVERIIRLLEESARLKDELNNLISSITHLVEREDSPVLKKVVEYLTKESVNIAQPVTEDLDLDMLETRLKEYLNELKQRIDNLKEYAEKLRKLADLVKVLENNISILNEWANAIKPLDPYLAGEAKRAIKLAEKVINLQESNLEIERLIIEVSQSLLEVHKSLKACRNLFERKIIELKKKIESAERIYKQARSLAYLENLTNIEKHYKELQSDIEELMTIEKEAPKVDTTKLFDIDKRIDNFINFCKSIIEKNMGKKEALLLKTLSGFATRKDAYPFHILIDNLSRKTNLEIKDVLLMLYKISRQNIAMIKVKVKC